MYVVVVYDVVVDMFGFGVVVLCVLIVLGLVYIMFIFGSIGDLKGV